MDTLKSVLKDFGIENVQNITPFGSGLINSSFKVVAENGKSYLLQKLNAVALTNIDIVLQNIENIGEFLMTKNETCLKLFKTKNGENCIKSGGSVYRLYPFIENSRSYDFSTSFKVISEVAFGFGRFDRILKDLPEGKVKISDEGFHNTRLKFEILKQAIQENRAKRLAKLQPEIEGVNDLLEFAKSKNIDLFEISNLMERGALPIQVVHNDTKLNNCLLDGEDNYLCVVDLDTAMPGLVMNDFGDGIRYIANKTTEDDENLQNVGVNLSSYEAFTRGFLKGLGQNLTKEEERLFVLSPISIAFELGCRFLTDYLNGDIFFKVEEDRKELNLIRARVQFAYCKSLIENISEERVIFDKINNKN